MASWRPSADLATLRVRAELLARARRYFSATGALEVETPQLVRHGVTDVHLQSLAVRAGDSPCGFLHTSPEYAMKRLLCAGSGDIYQISHVFRAGERGERHHPEFTMLEWYRVGLDDRALMDDVEGLVGALLEHRARTAAAVRVSYAQAFVDRLGIDPLVATTRELCAALEAARVDVPAAISDERDALLDLGLSQAVAPAFAGDRLTFLTDFPASQAALARVRGPVAARFEAFWGELELANGFHELADTTEQRSRFEQDRAVRRQHGLPDLVPDPHLLAALASGLPDCAGVALGFDRLMMVAMGARRIDDVMSFTFEHA
jgi:lysyl-tRNA synthetase class 2